MLRLVERFSRSARRGRREPKLDVCLQVACGEPPRGHAAYLPGA